MLPLFLFSEPALADGQPVADPIVEEGRRLSTEMQQLARREVWHGVDQMFVGLQALGIDVEGADYVLAARASEELGDIESMLHRLQLAVYRGAPGAAAWLREIEGSYGFVALRVRNRRRSQLQSMGGAFSPMDRQAVAWAQSRLQQDGFVEGYLPVGTYTLAGEVFEVNVERMVTVRSR